MSRLVWLLVVGVMVAGPARANDLSDARQSLHQALEERAPTPSDPPSFPTQNRDHINSAPGRGADKRNATAQVARAEAARQAADVVREAHVNAANKAASKSAREAAQAAQSDANGAPGQARSQAKRGVGNGKGNGANNGNGGDNNGHGNGNNGNGNGSGNNGTKK